MSYLLENEQKMLEIIFANRNKAYGAYQLRSEYGSTVFKALAFVSSGFIAMFSTALFLSQRPPEDPDLSGMVIQDTSVYIIKFGKEEKEPEAKKELKKEVSPARNVSSSAANSTIIKDSVEYVINTATTQASKGTESLAVEPDPGGNSGGNDTGSVTNKGKGGLPGGGEVKMSFEVDQLPEFEGGLKALYRFVSSHVRYPETASIANREGTVYVKFVVDETGKVGSVSVLNSRGYGLDEEAVRVVQLIPKFKSPAKANGHPVKVYYQLPISFKLR